jgi:hypothetical protein
MNSAPACSFTFRPDLPGTTVGWLAMSHTSRCIFWGLTATPTNKCVCLSTQSGRAWLQSSRELPSTAGRSMRCFRPLCQEVVPAQFGGGEQLAKLRRASQVCEHGIILQAGVGAVVSCDRTLEEPKREIFLSAEGKFICNPEPVLGRQGSRKLRAQTPWRSCPHPPTARERDRL